MFVPFLDTYDVQNVNITVDNGMISVLCEFAEGSLARGCSVQITKNGSSSTEQDIIHMANITRTNLTRVTDQMTITDLEGGKYMVMVFDLESDGSVATGPMYVNQVEIPIILPSPSSTPGDQQIGPENYHRRYRVARTRGCRWISLRVRSTLGRLLSPICRSPMYCSSPSITSLIVAIGMLA